METNTATTPFTALAAALAAAPSGQADAWLSYYRDWNIRFNENVVPKSNNPKDIQGDEYLYRVHMGLMIYDQGGHPLFKQLSPEEQEAVDLVRKGILRLFKNQKEGGIYDKFYQRASAAR